MPHVSIWKSALQKSWRRGDTELLTATVNAIWASDPDWLTWRLMILPAEEQWMLSAEIGYLARFAKEMKAETDSDVMRQKILCKLVDTTKLIKNKDADGLRTLGETLTTMLNKGETKPREELLEVLKAKTTNDQYQLVLEMAEVEKIAVEEKKVPKEIWGDIWTRVDAAEHYEERDADQYKYLREGVGAAYFRGLQGGMLGDRTLLVSVALLHLYHYYHEPVSMKTLVDDMPKAPAVRVDTWGDLETDMVIPWYVYDSHTGVGKRVLGYLNKSTLFQRDFIDWLWFFRESCPVNGISNYSWWWELGERASYISFGIKPERAIEIWQEELGPKVKKLVIRFLEEDGDLY